jgi:hypothetical protein
MMSILLPFGHGPALLGIQNAGQVLQPVGVCSISSTNIASSYVLRKDADAVTPSARRGGNDGPTISTHEELPVVH